MIHWRLRTAEVRGRGTHTCMTINNSMKQVRIYTYELCLPKPNHLRPSDLVGVCGRYYVRIRKL